jgi:hypothetical protein
VRLSAYWRCSHVRSVCVEEARIAHTTASRQVAARACTTRHNAAAGHVRVTASCDVSVVRSARAALCVGCGRRCTASVRTPTRAADTPHVARSCVRSDAAAANAECAAYAAAAVAATVTAITIIITEWYGCMCTTAWCVTRGACREDKKGVVVRDERRQARVFVDTSARNRSK